MKEVSLNFYKCGGAYQVSIDNEDGGYRLSGPSFIGNSQRLHTVKLKPSDARQIRRYLDEIDEG